MNANEIKQAIVRVVNENVPCGREFQDLRLTVQSAANRHFHCPEFSKALFLAIESGEVVAKGGKLWPGKNTGPQKIGGEPDTSKAPWDVSYYQLFNATIGIWETGKWQKVRTNNGIKAMFVDRHQIPIQEVTHYRPMPPTPEQELTRPEGE